MYWRIGKMILDRQNELGWGSRVIDRLATDLRRELGERRGSSRSNLFSMRALAAAWPDPAIVQQAVLGTADAICLAVKKVLTCPQWWGD